MAVQFLTGLLDCPKYRCGRCRHCWKSSFWHFHVYSRLQQQTNVTIPFDIKRRGPDTRKSTPVAPRPMRVAHPRYPFFEEVWRESSLDYVSLTDRINVRTYCAWCAVLYWSVWRGEHESEYAARVIRRNRKWNNTQVFAGPHRHHALVTTSSLVSAACKSTK